MRTKKEISFKLRATPEWKNILTEKAQKCGISESDFVRKAVADSAVKIVQKIDCYPDDLRYQIVSIGKNLNQLAKAANSAVLSGTLTDEIALGLCAHIYLFCQELNELKKILKEKK